MANQTKWYKRDPLAALDGMSELSLEERGAYNTVLDLIYARDGKVLDDDRFLAGWMRADIRIWRRIRKRLIDLGKLYIQDGNLRNSRADREVSRALSRIASAIEAGLISAARREAATHVSNDLDAATVERTLQQPTPTPTSRYKTSVLPAASSTEPRARDDRTQCRIATQLGGDGWEVLQGLPSNYLDHITKKLSIVEHIDKRTLAEIRSMARYSSARGAGR